MENEGEEKSGEKGKENAGTKEEEEGKATGKRGNSTGKAGATRLKTRTGGTESPRTEKEGQKGRQRGRSTGTKGTQGKYRACVRSRTQRKDKREGQRP